MSARAIASAARDALHELCVSLKALSVSLLAETFDGGARP